LVRPPVSDNMCIRCKGARLLCGKSQCPILMKHSILKSVLPDHLQKIKTDKKVFGASPPAVFVGHNGYPFVNIGPLLPIGEFAEHKDTKILDSPETWFGKSIDEIVGYRSSMLRSSFNINVKINDNIEQQLERLNRPKRKLLEATQELTMASNSVDTEAELSRIRISMNYDTHSQPQGPSGVANKIDVIDNVKVLKPVDKVVSDRDLNATDAIMGYLYNAENISVTSIQRLFSAGLLGSKKRRKLVPTRWTITAVDDIIGKKLIPKLQHFPEIDKYYTFYGEYLDNKFLILLIPDLWAYEMNECWNTESIWNQEILGVNSDSQIMATVVNDYEIETGRKNYASNVTGAYYAARKEVEEFLFNSRKQARAIVFREVAGGYIVPLGVWVIRETVRNILSKGWNGPTVRIHEDLKSALGRISEVFRVPLKKWLKASKLIKYTRSQTRLDKWLKK
jgi:DNA repair protein NreA